MSFITGKELTERFQGQRFVKVLTHNLTHRGLKYHDGLNTDPRCHKYDDILDEYSGIYFTTEDQVLEWLFYLPNLQYISIVTLPDDAVVVKTRLGSYKTNQLILDLDNRVDIGDFIKWDEMDLSSLVRREVDLLRFLPESYFTQKLCEYAISTTDGHALKYIPKTCFTQEVCDFALKHGSESWRYVPKIMRTKEICKRAVTRNGYNLKYVPYYLRTREMCELALESNKYALKYVPNECVTEKMCECAAKNDGRSLKYVPECYITREMCENAVEEEGHALKYVPECYITREICKTAVKNDGCALKYVPEYYITKELCKLAGLNKKHDNRYITKYIPSSLLSEEAHECIFQRLL